MNGPSERLNAVLQRIRDAERRFQRPPDSVALLAVSKTKPVAAIRAVAAAGQLRFGENYVQEALAKIEFLQDLGLEWHFIGPIQSNKTRRIAEYFDWVHSIERLQIARRLHDQRPQQLAPLNICLQVNISAEVSKSGLSLQQLPALAQAVTELPRLRLRGLMAIPAPSTDFDQQRRSFNALFQAQQALIADGIMLDTLSMGMSDDLEAAIAEGATIVRVGTAIFGPRDK